MGEMYRDGDKAALAVLLHAAGFRDEILKKLCADDEPTKDER